MSELIRPRHKMVMEALRTLDVAALTKAECYFGGGTRIALVLGEYRESADVDFLCASRSGYRMLRSAVTQLSLGLIATRRVKLAREVVSDRYGIRTFLDVNGEKLKFEVVLEGRIPLSGGMDGRLPVPTLDPTSCFAEKFLANADRWTDASVLGRDVVDLAYMAVHWGDEPLRAGFERAVGAYGKVVSSAARRAATQMIEQAAWRKRCVSGLEVRDTRTLLAGLKLLAARAKMRLKA
jgi:hypothetical protein